MKAGDLMKPLQEYVRPDSTFREAVNFLRAAGERVGAKALPVLDETGKLVGMLSTGDILKAVFPPYLFMAELGEFTWDGMVESVAKKVAGKKVAEVMTREVFTVEEKDSLMECVDHIVKHNAGKLPVVDKAGKVVGMIYDQDVFFAIVKTMLEENRGGGK